MTEEKPPTAIGQANAAYEAKDHAGVLRAAYAIPTPLSRRMAERVFRSWKRLYPQRMDFDVGDTRVVARVALSRDGLRLAAASDSGQLFLYDLAQAEPYRPLAATHARAAFPRAAEALAFTPDGAAVIALGPDDRAVRVFDFATGQESNPWPPNKQSPHALAVTARGLAFVAGHGPTLRCIDLACGTERELRPLDYADSFYVHALAVTPDETRAVGAATLWRGREMGSGLACWDLASGVGRVVLAQTEHQRAWTAAITADAATAFCSWGVGGNWVLSRVDVATGTITATFDQGLRVSRRAHREPWRAQHFALAPNARSLVLASCHDNNLEIVDARSGERLHQLGCGQASAVAISANGLALAVGALRQLRVWRFEPGVLGSG